MPIVERLEARFVLATITPTVTGTNVALAWTGTTTAADDVVLSVSSGTYTFDNTASTNVINVTTDPSITITNNGTDDVMIAAASGFTISAITFTDGNATGGNIYDVESVDVPTSISTSTGTGTDAIGLAVISGLMSGITGNVSIDYPGSVTAGVTINDFADTAPTTPVITATNTTDLGPATISYAGSISSILVEGGSGGNSFYVAGNPVGAATNIDTGSGNDSVTVVGSQLATGTMAGGPPPTLAIDGQGGTNTLYINAQGTTATITPSSPIDGTVSFGTGTSFAYSNFSSTQLTSSPISAQGVDIFPVLNTAYSATPIATFQDSSGVLPASSYTVSVNWGDGTTTPVPSSDLTLVGTTYEVNATHTYASTGSFTILTTITNNTSGASAIASGTAIVSPAALVAGTFTPSASPIPVTTGTALALSATFTNGAAPLPPLSDYSVSINWGDGSPATPGTITLNGTTFTVAGSHAYAQAGSDTISVTISVAGETLLMTTTATVANPSVGAGTALTETQGTASGAIADIATVTPASGSPNLDPTAYTAVIDWGDGATTTSGTITSGTAGALDVGSSGHTYGKAGSFTVTVNVYDAQGYLVGTSPSTLVATVNAPAIAASSATLTETAGTGTGLLTAATITAATGSPNPDPNSYTAVIDWGDGSTVTDATITSPSAGTLDVNTSGHTYGNPGSYTATVTVDNALGYLVGSTTFAVTAGSLTVTPSTTIAPSAGVATGPLTVATLTATPSPTPTAYTAVVDWGDGSTPVDATVSSPSSGTLDVNTSGHTYPQGGTYTVGISVFDAQGYQVGTATTSVTVSVTLTDGKLSPQSDTGISNTDGITNDTTPTFVGNTSPGTTVEVFAAASGGSTPGNLIATGVGDGSGVWTATVNTPLADGTYTITAEAVDSSGTVLATDAIGTVVINTVGPVVNSVVFVRGDATMTITFQDNLSGLDYASITNSAFYHLYAKPLSNKVPVKRYVLPTSITVTPGASGTTLETVTVQFYRGRELRGGLYFLVIDSGNDNNGIQDVAGNAMSGNYYGTFPSGDGLPGGNFVAMIAAFHNKVFAPFPIKDGWVPPVSTPGTQPVSIQGSDPPTITHRHADPHDKAVALTTHQETRAASRGAKPAVAMAPAEQSTSVNDLAMEALVLDDTTTTTHHHKN